MKIGILTFHCAHNHGAVLQAYALQNFLSENGYQVEIIDYRPDYLIYPYEPFAAYKNLRSLIGGVILFPQRFIKHKRFEKFINNNLVLSSIKYFNGAFKKEYDFFVLGSDQIWNSTITNGDPVFFGNFDRREESKIIAYAASMEVDREDDSVELSTHQTELQKFSSIGVREDILQDKIQKLAYCEVRTVLDPTLLVDSSVFNNIISRTQDEKYILVYQVKKDTWARKLSTFISKKINIPKIIFSASSIEKADLFNKYAAISPQKFLGLFSGTDYVVTTSFHGVAFSIIFRKQFVCIVNKERGNYRISSLLKKLGLIDRMIYAGSLPPKNVIDYDVVYKILEQERLVSSNFLLNSLKF
ncbi:polysaccharide pyruvyl transferase family protein [Zavarzinia compransoris]|uniref:Polysaccharide pyruvyl transferase domain-containing protein n=1 Tax=Zavarzinia compransoris TaxID=1264899 RepID=A0A317E5S8_9PROT|nr:polysaccharide pyruvyl transferase family protein [Zavarzinia compransoris]PWR21546.1 hypothetical protein DKG75_05935 [Zavarzinia compransoris]TDP45687.1 polysaccharide pyruvyl transferase [Zavarzinia compransoris]